MTTGRFPLLGCPQLGDLIGTGLLALAFQFLYIIGDRDSDLGD